ncbi:hypothetical protein [Aldersonia kunmingensis]|uniref:hypothetical protein n=1 Tax=Aldersonia kunmingensis TaxID=408066 RepID=UPI000829689A|nr:hypothetical protein [Aldersonia kunmingensis]
MMDKTNHPDPVDSLRWITARIVQLLAVDQPDIAELAVEARAALALHTDDHDSYSNGHPVVTCYWLGDQCVSAHVNSPASWKASR